MNFNSLFKSLLESTIASRHGFEDNDSVVEQLLPYINDPNIYLHFSEFNKIGNNPKSKDKYNTPQGIYLYPLKIYWNKFITKFNIESLDDIKSDLKKVNKYPKLDYIYKIKKDIDGRQYKFTNIIPFKADSRYILVARVLVDETDGFMDFAKDVTQTQYTEYVDTLKNYFIDLYKNDNSRTGDDVVETLSQIEKIAVKYCKVKTNLAYLWFYSKLLAFGENDEGTINVHNWVVDKLPTKIPSVRWAYLLRKVLGFSGFLDSSNLGIIHPSEKTQAVVFNALDVDHIDAILNKEKYDFKKEIDSNRDVKNELLAINVAKNKKSINGMSQKKIAELCKYNPDIAKFLTDDDAMISACKSNAMVFGVVQLSPEAQMKLVVEQPSYIKQIKNPTKEAIEYAIFHKASLASYFIRQLKDGVNEDLWTDELLEFIMPFDVTQIRYVNNPSLKVQMSAIKRDVSALNYIDNPDIKAQLYVAKRNPLIFKSSNNKKLNRFIISAASLLLIIIQINKLNSMSFDYDDLKELNLSQLSDDDKSILKQFDDMLEENKIDEL